MESVFGIADGAHRKSYSHFGVGLPQQLDALSERTGALAHAELLFLKKPLRPFGAVIYNLARLPEPIHMVGAEREETDVEGRWQSAVSGFL